MNDLDRMVKLINELYDLSKLGYIDVSDIIIECNCADFEIFLGPNSFNRFLKIDIKLKSEIIGNSADVFYFDTDDIDPDPFSALKLFRKFGDIEYRHELARVISLFNSALIAKIAEVKNSFAAFEQAFNYEE